MRDRSIIDYASPGLLNSYFKSHPAYFSDFIAFQHIELWLPGLTFKEEKFSSDESKIPLVLTCRVADNNQNLIGPINFYFGSINYSISDFKTKENISSSETLINNKQKLPRIFESEGNSNWGYQNGLFISMQDNFLGRDLFEVKIEDETKGLSGRLLFKTKFSVQ